MSSKAVYSGVGVPGSGLLPSSRALDSKRSGSRRSQKGRHGSLNLPPEVEVDEYMDPESRVLQPDVADADAMHDITDKLSGEDDEAWDSERGSREHSGRFAVCRTFCCRYRFAVAGFAVLLLTTVALGAALVSEKRKNAAVGAQSPRGSPATDAAAAAADAAAADAAADDAAAAADAAADDAIDAAAAAAASTPAPIPPPTPTPTPAPTKPEPLSETAVASTPAPTPLPTPMPTLAPTPMPTLAPTPMPTLAPTKPEPLSEAAGEADSAALKGPKPVQQEDSMSMSMPMSMDMSLSSLQRRRRTQGRLNKHKRVKKVWKVGVLE